MRTLVIQSASERDQPDWLAPCLQSTRGWARERGYDYRLWGDEALELTPPWYRAKLGARLPIVADLARLLLIRDALASGYQRACWLDSDVVVFAPGRLVLPDDAECAFGRERWVQKDRGGRWQVRLNVHNAVCSFVAGCPVLPFLIHTTERIIARADPEHIAPQMVGPKLLSALHNLTGFRLIDSIGALSPAVRDDLEQGGGDALRAMQAAAPEPLAGVNLCASVNGDRDLAEICERLIDAGRLEAPGETVGAS
ncbi:MAG: hypothetical protein GWM88_14965 [Pseudomonadales bacterium]|nr:hypothetical protein [Pseudomonadales bacterium]NIX09238.1 hypothetical protein [Pseudomonadales bacterium]